MISGMLIKCDPNLTMSQNISNATKHFLDKYGQLPNLVQVNPTENHNLVTQIEVASSQSVMVGYMLLGRKGEEVRIRRTEKYILVGDDE